MPHDTPSSGRFRHRRLVLAVLLLLLFGLGLWIGAPFALEQVLLHHMQKAGIEHPRVRVETLRPGRIAVSGLGGANLNLEVQRAVLHLSFQGLLQGSADELEIHGLHWRLGWTESGLDPGLPFVDTPTTTPDAPPPLLPVKRIRLRSSFLQWQYADISWPQPFAADIWVQDEQSTVRLTFRSSLLGLPLHMEGQADFRAGTAEIHGRIPDSGRPQAPQSVQEPTLRAGLNFAWQQETSGAGSGRLRADVYAAHLNLPERDMGLENLAVNLNAEMDQELRLQELDADLRLDSLRLKHYLLSSASLNLREAGTEFNLKCNVDEPGTFQLALEGRHRGIRKLVHRDGSWQGEADYRLQGNLPRQWVNAMAEKAVLQSPLLPMQSNGTLHGSVEPSSGQWTWQAGFNAQSAQMGPVDLALADAGLTLDGAFCRAPLQGEFGSQGLAVSLTGAKSLGFQAAEMAVADKHYRLSKVRLKPQSSPRIHYQSDSDGKRTIDLELHPVDPIRIQGPDVQAALRGATLEGRFQQTPGQAWHGLVQARLDHGQLALPEQDLALRSISATIPWGFGNGGGEHRSGRFEVRGIRIRGVEVPGPEGSVGISNTTLRLDGLWRVAPEITLNLDLNLDLADTGLSGHARVHSDWFDLPRPETLARFSPALQELELDISGEALLDMRIAVQGGRVEPFVEFQLRDTALHAAKQNLRLHGLTLKTAVDSLQPLQTAPQQGMHLTFSELEWQDFAVHHGDFRLRLVPEALIVDSGACSLEPGGDIRLYEGRWDLERKTGSARIYLHEINALRLIQEVTDNKLVGSGLFSGRFALAWDHQGLRLNGGHLYALPGSGTLGVKDEAWLEKLLFYVRQSMAGQKYLSLLSERLEQALREFEYDFFSLRLVPQGEEVTARVELRGQGKRGDPPQRVGSLVFNINDVQQALNQALHWGKQKAVRRALEELMEPAP
ncbi:MAG: intermembrane phospholipid transport protein YdbH family protein [Thermodesulfobacteriota bacterium]